MAQRKIIPLTGWQLTLKRQPNICLADSKIIPAQPLVARNRHPCHQTFCLPNRGRVRPFLIRPGMDRPRRG